MSRMGQLAAGAVGHHVVLQWYSSTRDQGAPLTAIGSVEPRDDDEVAGVLVHHDGGAARVDLPPGHDHFSR